MFQRQGTTINDFTIEMNIGEFPHLLIFNDSVANILQYSTDNVNFGDILNGEGIEFEDANASTVWIKNKVPGANVVYRVKAWGSRKMMYPTELGQSNRALTNPAVPSALQSYETNFRGGV